MNQRNKSAEGSRPYRLLGIIILCLLSGLIGGALTRNFGTSSYTISYVDFISIVLSGVSLLITVLAVFLAVYGFIGWSTIEQKVQAKTEDFLKTSFREGGPLDQKIVARIQQRTDEIMFDGVDPVGNGPDQGPDQTL